MKWFDWFRCVVSRKVASPATQLPAANSEPPAPHEMRDPDRQKIHNEINQCMNQRFLLTGAAVAAFGVVANRVFLNITQPSLDHLANAAFLSLAYSGLLAVLFYQSQKLRVIVRIWSSYLLEKGESQWEYDWFYFRKMAAKDLSTTDLRAHTSVFKIVSALMVFCLGILGTADSFFSCRQQTCSAWTLLAAPILASVLCFAYICWKEPGPTESQLRKQWIDVVAASPASRTAKVSPQTGKASGPVV